MSDNADFVQAFDFSVDLTKALLWQYDNAPNLTSLVNFKNAWYETNNNAFWKNWIYDVFDINTCNSFGLQVWAIILGISISNTYQVPVPNAYVWGFGIYNQNFNNGNFFNAGTETIGLDEVHQRILLKLRYYQLTGKCTIPAINAMLFNILGSYGTAYILPTTGNVMSPLTYVFGWIPDQQLLAILNNIDILPRPAGVEIAYQFYEFLTDENGNYLTDENGNPLYA